jgi:hypothetical protein
MLKTNVSLVERISLREWNTIAVYVPGLQPIHIQRDEVEEVTDKLLVLKDSKMSNENGDFTVSSCIQLNSIATIDFIVRSKIIKANTIIT